ncbi:MAG: NADH-quinone oxidoreductase subunit J [Chloroflexi bacterium]|nr:NADH-quinone oxidoreductase subunit J [Chloroflexota bacterium]
MTGAQFLFYALGLATVMGGLGVVLSRNVVHSALALLLSLIAVAGIYVLLYAEFLALVQVLIYGGAIVILLLFVLMLTRSGESPLVLDNPQKPVALVVSLLFMAIAIVSFFLTRWKLAQAPRGVDFSVLGGSLFQDWVLPFEVASLVLLVALMGAIIIARESPQ